MKTEGTINWLDSCIVCDGRQERRKEGMPPGMSESVLSEPVNVVNTVFLCSPILLSDGDMIVNPRESVGYAQPCVDNADIFPLQSRNRGPIGNTFSEQMSACEF